MKVVSLWKTVKIYPLLNTYMWITYETAFFNRVFILLLCVNPYQTVEDFNGKSFLYQDEAILYNP